MSTSCEASGCIPPFQNLSSCSSMGCTSVEDCYDSCKTASTLTKVLEVYIGDNPSYSHSSNTQCGEAKYDYRSIGRGPVFCDRSTTARYVFIVKRNTSSSILYLNELKIFAEKEIGRTISSFQILNGTL